jgi:hypothetical protein
MAPAIIRQEIKIILGLFTNFCNYFIYDIEIEFSIVAGKCWDYES